MINIDKYYKILEIDKNDTLDNIKKSYRKLSLKYCPNSNNNNVYNLNNI